MWADFRRRIRDVSQQRFLLIYHIWKLRPYHFLGKSLTKERDEDDFHGAGGNDYAAYLLM